MRCLEGERVKTLLSDDHFLIDGTLIDVWASMKSLRPKDGGDDDAPPGGGRNAERDFRGHKRSNETHASTTDADAPLYRKGDGQPSRLCFMGHLPMETHKAPIVDAALAHATGTAEREAALVMPDRRKRRRRITLGADNAHDIADFVGALHRGDTTPHIAINSRVTKTGKRRKTSIDRRIMRHPGYAVSQRTRKRIEESVGRIKTTAGLAKTRHRDLDRAGWMFSGSAELLEDGTLEIEFACHLGDEAVLKAERATSSAACWSRHA